MQIPLTDTEFLILDYLADGALQLGWLVRELHHGKHAVETAVLINGLAKLVERQLVHYCQVPGGPNYTSPSPEMIHAQIISVLNNSDQLWWLELTENGQNAWEAWQQTHFGS